MPEPDPPATVSAQEAAPRTRLGRPLHVSGLAWYGGSLLVFAAVVVMVALSTWQYSRAKPHTDAATLAASQAQPAVPAAQVLGGASELTADMVGRKVVVTGHYLPDKQWLVKRAHDGNPGFLVVTGFVPTGPGHARLTASMLVVRGWLPSTHAPQAPTGRQELTAWIAPPEPVSGTLADSLPAGRLPELAPARVTARLPAPLLDGYLGLVHPAAPLQAMHEPNPVPKSGWSLVNLGYSLQWLLFAAGAMIVWMLQVRDARRGPTDDEPNGPDDDAAAPEDGPTASQPVDQAAGAGTS